MRLRNLLNLLLTLAVFASVVTCAQASLIDAGCGDVRGMATCSEGKTQVEHQIIDGVVGDVSTTKFDSSELSNGEIPTRENELSVDKLASEPAVEEYIRLLANPHSLQRLKPPQAKRFSLKV